MGMYDHITCLMPLPVIGTRHQHGFQTKDLGKNLSCYEIDEDGQLWEMSFGDTKEKSSITKAITFYDACGEGYGWMEFDAIFEEGLCKYVVVRDDNKPLDAEDREFVDTAKRFLLGEDISGDEAAKEPGRGE